MSQKKVYNSNFKIHSQSGLIMSSTYFWIISITLLPPLVLSFVKKSIFIRNWKFAGMAIFIVSTLFLVWDFIFTKLRIWEFNEDYIIGSRILGLPIEEFGYFLVIPYFCICIYESLIIWLPKLSFRSITISFSWILLIGCVFILLKNFDRIYTSITAALIVFTILNQITITKGQYRSHLYIAWLICAIPFFIIHQLMADLPIIIYNEEYLMSIKLGNVPLENFFYLLLYMMWLIALYEKFRRKAEIRQSKKKHKEIKVR